MRTLLRTLTLTLLLVGGAFLTSAQAQSTGAPEWLPEGDWTTEDDPVEVFVQPDGDSAFVYDAANGSFGRAKQDDGDWRFKCPGMEQGDFYTLSGTTEDLGALQTVVEDLVSEGRATGLAPGVFEKAECIRAFWAHLDTLLTEKRPLPEGQAPTWTYAKECKSNMYNATVTSARDSLPISPVGYAEPGDTLAAYAGGECVGHGAWTDEGVTFAVAGTDSLTDFGYAEGERIRIEVQDTSREVAYRTQATWVGCTEEDDPNLCGDGLYSDGSLHELAGLVVE